MNPVTFHRKKAALRRHAKKQLIAYFKHAQEVFKQNPALAHRLTKKARRLALKHRFRIPRPYNRRYCRNCLSFLMPGVNVSIRTKNGHIVYFCKECRHIRRYSYISKK